MKNIFKISTLSMITILALTSCGSGGGSTPSATIEKGYFIDSGVEGLDYEASPSGKRGITAKDGSFDYIKGDKVKFSLGDFKLGEVTPQEDGLVTAKTLVDEIDMSEEAKVEAETLMLQVLQALDIDGDATNGIQVTDETKKTFTTISEEPNTSDFEALSSIDESELLSSNPELQDMIDKDKDGIIDVDEDKAIAHFADSQEKWERGERPTSDGSWVDKSELEDNLIDELLPEADELKTPTLPEIDDIDSPTQPEIDTPDLEEIPEVNTPDSETTPDSDILKDNNIPSITGSDKSPTMPNSDDKSTGSDMSPTMPNSDDKSTGSDISPTMPNSDDKSTGSDMSPTMPNSDDKSTGSDMSPATPDIESPDAPTSPFTDREVEQSQTEELEADRLLEEEEKATEEADAAKEAETETEEKATTEETESEEPQGDNEEPQTEDTPTRK